MRWQQTGSNGIPTRTPIESILGYVAQSGAVVPHDKTHGDVMSLRGDNA